MDIIKSIQRLGWRFSEASKRSDLSFKINQNDLEALKSLSEYVEQCQKQQYEANELFTKMYIFTSMRVIEKEGSSLLNNSARKRIINILKKPLSQIIGEFKESVNDNEKNAFIREMGIELTHPATKTAQHKEKEKELIKTHENAFKDNLTKDAFQYDDISEVLIAEVNQMINNFR